MDTTTAPNTTKRYIPGEDPLPELMKHLSSQQLYELAQALEYVSKQTGHGSVSVDFRNGHPRFIRVEYGAELKP